MTRIQIYSPHPDDADLFAGGAFLHHLAQGDAVEIILMTRGERGSWRPGTNGENLQRLRTDETLARLSTTSQARVSWLDCQDGAVAQSTDAIDKICLSIQEQRPEIIYLPESQKRRSWYWHKDHLATGRMVSEAASRSGLPVKLRYYHTTRPNHFLRVNAFEGAVREGLRAYRSQWGFWANPPFLLYLHGFLRILVNSLWGIKSGLGQAEGFREA